jgi:hypothetical protein
VLFDPVRPPRRGSLRCPCRPCPRRWRARR